MFIGSGLFFLGSTTHNNADEIEPLFCQLQNLRLQQRTMNEAVSALLDRLAELEKHIHQLETHPQGNEQIVLSGDGIILRQEIERMTQELNDIKSELKQSHASAAEDFHREAKSGSESALKEVLYQSALAKAEDKLPILCDYVDWQRTLIEQESMTAANERFVRLVHVCDTMLSQGSVKDILGTAPLKEKLTAIRKSLDSREEDAARQAVARLRNIENSVSELKTSEACREALNALESLILPKESEADKEALSIALHNRMSCLTSPHEALMVPIITENGDTPWNEWIEHFVLRLQADDTILSDEQKLADLQEADTFTAEAVKAGCDCRGIEAAALALAERQWQKQARAALEAAINPDNKSTKAAPIAEVLANASLLGDRKTPETQALLSRLNLKLAQEAKEKLDSGLQRLKEMENSLPRDTYLQLLSSTQSQYVQLLMQIKEWEGQAPRNDTGLANYFVIGTQALLQAIAGLDQILAGQKNIVVIESMTQEKERNDKYREFADTRIAAAKKEYKAGQEIAKEWFSTKGNDEAQKHYKAAWQELRKIHPGDLQSVAPDIYTRYTELKTKIDNCVNLTEEDKKTNPELQRIYDLPL